MSFCIFSKYRREKTILQNQWEPEFPLLKTIKRQGLVITYYRTPVVKSKTDNLTQYTLKMDFVNACQMLEIEFCDKYSWVMNLDNIALTGFYRKIDSVQKQFISTSNYGELLFGPQPHNKYPMRIIKNTELILKCDLQKNIAEVYINNKFCERIYFNNERAGYFISIRPPAGEVIFSMFKIYDSKGELLFNGDYRFIFFWKISSQFAFIIGVAIILILAFFAKNSIKGILYFAATVICIEFFLRSTETYNPALDIHKMTVKWEFEKITNLFGQFDNPEKIVLTESNKQIKTYYITRPKDSIFIICMGSSPIVGLGSSNMSAFLEEKLNKGEIEKKHKVFNAGLYATEINSIRQNIYFTEVLARLNPDALVIYSLWGPSETEDVLLYKRAKNVLKENSSWIKNQRLLYMALEFKRPIKEIVYLYNFLCESYLFFGIENMRKNLFAKLPIAITAKSSNEISEFSFEKTLHICKERGIKVFLIPQFDFQKYRYEQRTKNEMERICKENTNVYYLDLQNAFIMNGNFLLAYDIYHLTEKGSRILADEIYQALIKEKIFNTEIKMEYISK